MVYLPVALRFIFFIAGWWDEGSGGIFTEKGGRWVGGWSLNPS